MDALRKQFPSTRPFEASWVVLRDGRYHSGHFRYEADAMAYAKAKNETAKNGRVYTTKYCPAFDYSF